MQFRESDELSEIQLLKAFQEDTRRRLSLYEYVFTFMFILITFALVVAIMALVRNDISREKNETFSQAVVISVVNHGIITVIVIAVMKYLEKRKVVQVHQHFYKGVEYQRN